MTAKSGIVTDDAIRTMVKLEAPLTDIKDDGADWQLGPLHVSHREASGGMGWRQRFHPATRLRKQWFSLPDGSRGWAVIYRWEDRGPDGAPVEYAVGWVQPERETDVDRWIAFLNDEIQKRVAQPSVSDAQPTAPAAAPSRDPGALFRLLGLPVPAADSIDGFIDAVKQWGEIGKPVDLRTTSGTKASPLARTVFGWTRGAAQEIQWLAEDIPREVAVAENGPASGRVHYLASQALTVAFAAPDIAADLLRPLVPIVERAIVEENAHLEAGTVNLVLVSLLDLANAMECVGCALSRSAWETMRDWLPRIKVERDAEDASDYWTVAFAALALDQRFTYSRAAAVDPRGMIEFTPRQTFEFNMQALLRHLAGALEHRATLDQVWPAWEDVLWNFPSMNQAMNIDDGTLLWIARTIFHRLRGAPLRDVAQHLHDSAWALAGTRS